MGDREYDFVLGFNSRNIRRKSIPDTMLAFKAFLDTLPEEKADKCCLLLHTQPIDDNGTNLYAVRDLIFGDKAEINIIFSDRRGSVEYMNHFYNVIDGCILLSSNEGWGLSLTEAMMCGRMIIANVTGGMQDQMRFTDENGKWIEFNENFSTNHLGRYRNCGEWAIPVFPSNISLQGSVPTPYIFDDRVDFRDAAKAIRELYDMPKEERERRGLEARKWVTSDESMMSAKHMCDNVIRSINDALTVWTPRKSYDLIKVKDLPKKTLKNIVSI
jgi:glycosyltransferase involved in cell wall biosynthesis